jgi:predicted metalloendopeptidase
MTPNRADTKLHQEIKRMIHAGRSVLRAFLAALGCALASGLLMETGAEAAPLAISPAAPGVDLAGMDPTVAPGEDFFAYANGTWLRTTEIPPDRSWYGTDSALAELTMQRTADLIREVSGAPGADAPTRKVGDYYSTFMDEATIEREGLAPLHPILRRIASLTDRRQLARFLGSALRADVDLLNSTRLHTDNLFGLWVAQDLDQPTRYTAFLVQGGLAMPDREYYLSPSPHMAQIRDRFRAHIAAVLQLAQVKDAPARAARIFELESRMAAVHLSRTDSEDVVRGDNHWPRVEFGQRAPGLDWETIFAAAGLARQRELVVWQPKAVQGLAALVASESVQTWKDYLTFHAIEHASGYLPQAFVQEQFAFYGTVLAGTPQLRPRWKRAVDATSAALGEAVGKLYVERYFPASEKARAQSMVKDLLAAFDRRIDNLTWMTPQTKVRAKEKLATLKVAVGYPDVWRDYSALRVVKAEALGNAERAEQFEYQRNLAKLGRPVDRSEWAMTPQLVNAVNLPVMNALNFPAAILQPPYFDPNRPAAMDYGAIGAVIGHEISHSFDDQGAMFDARGRLSNWWTAEDLAHFRAAGAALVSQYDHYRPFADLAVNGQQTLSENIADVAGIAVAYDAYRLTLQGAPAPSDSGLTGEQQFFVSFAQSWREKAREAAIRQQIVTDGHAPAMYRAQTVRNLDPWYVAFKVEPGQALYLAPADRVRVW